MATWETPLVLFTVLTQWAIGIALMIFIAEIFMAKCLEGDKLKKFRIAGMAIFPIVALGLICSVFHLGQPFKAATALSNLGTAALSAEILSFSIVAVLALVYSFVWFKKSDNAGLRKITGGILVIAGIVALVATANVYALPAHDSWNNWTTLASFALTAVAIGSITMVSVLAKVEDAQCCVKVFSIIALVAVAAIVVVFGSYLGLLDDAILVNMISSPIFIIRVLAGIFASAMFVALAMFGKKNLVYAGLVCIILGELCGRILFYSSTISLYPWF